MLSGEKDQKQDEMVARLRLRLFLNCQDEITPAITCGGKDPGCPLRHPDCDIRL